jgi:hypothetical protein
MPVSSSVFLWSSHSSRFSVRSLIYFSWFLYKVRNGIEFQSFTCGCPVFSATFVEEAVFSVMYIFDIFVKNQVVIAVWAYHSGSSVLTHWSTCLFLCPYHAVFVTIACSIIWNLELWCLQALFFLFRIGLAIWSLLCFLMKFRIIFSSSVKNVIGILMDIAWIYRLLLIV